MSLDAETKQTDLPADTDEKPVPISVPDEASAAQAATARPAKPERTGMFSALRLPNYRIFLGGSFISNIGTWMQRVAQDWLVLELSGGSGLAVGITTALQFLPMLLLSPYGGLLADRFDKRTILRITQAWMALAAGALGLLAVTGAAVTWHVYLIAFLFGLGTAIDNPSRQSFVNEVVGSKHLANAIGLNSATFHASRIIGPALAGLVIAAFGSGWAILSNAVTYAAFIAALGLIDGKLLQVSQRPPRAKRQIREGVSYVFGNPEILLVLCVAFFVGTFGMNFQMTSALMAQQEFHKGAQEYGILGTIMAVGSLTGALLAARRREAPRGRFIVKMAVLYGFILIITGLMPSYLTYALILPITGFVALLTMTASNAAIQLNVAPQLRGRVMALYAMVMMGGTPIGAPILGWLGELFGPRWTLLAGGGLTVLGVLASALVLARRQQMSIVPMLTPRPHFELRDR